MTIVLTHIQRLVLRRLAASQFAVRFDALITDRTNRTRVAYGDAVAFLLDHGYIALENPLATHLAYTITMKGRRELYPRASRNI